MEFTVGSEGLPGPAGGAAEQATNAAVLKTITHLRSCSVNNLAIASVRSKRLQSPNHFKRGSALVHAVKVQTGYAAVAQLVAQIGSDI